MKKNKIPPKSYENSCGKDALESLKASGKECKNAVANNSPTEKLTIFSTIDAKNLKDKVAAAVILITPADNVAKTIHSNNILFSMWFSAPLPNYRQYQYRLREERAGSLHASLNAAVGL